MTVHDFDWYGDRLEVAKWESQEVGSRSGFFNCPVHGGSDSLHITEKNGKALLNCFACGASVMAITEAIEDGPKTETEAVPIRVRKVAGARGRRQDEPGARGAERGVRLPAASTNPLAWMAARCGLTEDQLLGMKLPLSVENGKLAFEFAGAGVKLRGIGEGKKGKDFSWTGSYAPPLWPLPAKPGDEIVVCEGEADAICLMYSGYEAYSVTKGSAGEIPAVVWEALEEAGVRTVWLIFDADDAGRKGRASAAEGARAAGLTVKEGRVAGILPLAGEKDARDVALREGYPLLIEHDANEESPTLLSEVEPIQADDLLLGRLHPQEHTILYGDGGTGKGVIAAWWVARLTRAGMRVLVVDYEYHVNYEWRPRVEGFGGDMKNVAVLQPKRPIWDIAAWLRDWADEFDYVVIDSVSYACVGEEVEKSVTATKYSMAVNQLAKPVLSIAHVTKANSDPNHPFGSIFWSNGARVTIAVSRKVQEDPESDRVLRNPKTNQRGPFHPVAIRWDWLDQSGPPGCGLPDIDKDDDQWGMPHHLHEESSTPAKAKLLRDAYSDYYAKHGKEGSTAELLGIIKQSYPDIDMSEGHVRKELVSIRKRLRPMGRRRARDAQEDEPAAGV